MHYLSTRAGSAGDSVSAGSADDRAPLDFEAVMLAGLARDGGLYVPERWPAFTTAELRGLAGLSYAELTAEIVARFAGDAIPRAALDAIAAETAASFAHKAVAPLKQIDRQGWLLELFHGPTLAFKDFALQLLGRLFDHVLARRAERLTIVGATSGDTGSAAIAACEGRERIDIVILYPEGRVSEVQRRQMTTRSAANVHTLAVAGSFDDCQDLVKAMFADAPFRDKVRLSAVNSINFARILAQIVYYFYGGLALGAPTRTLDFCVPTGNFGNVYAGYAARAMGLPVGRLIVASNRNDILTRYFRANDMSMRAVEPSTSPSMDIQISSNFERLLFDLLGRDGRRVAAAMAAFRAEGRLAMPEEAFKQSRALFAADSLDDAGTVAEIARIHKETGEIIDPHTACGTHAARAYAASAAGSGNPIVTLATAHPAKFPQVVAQATGITPALPARMAGLMAAPERIARAPNDLATVEAFVLARSRAAGMGAGAAA